MPRAHQCDASKCRDGCCCCSRRCVTQPSAHLAAEACFRLHQITIHGAGSPSKPSVVGLIGHRDCFVRPGGRAARAVTCHVISWAWRGIAWAETLPVDSAIRRHADCTELYSSVQDMMRVLPVSCRCLCPPAWRDQDALAPTCTLHTSSSAPSEPLGRPPWGGGKTLSIRVQL